MERLGGWCPYYDRPSSREVVKKARCPTPEELRTKMTTQYEFKELEEVAKIIKAMNDLTAKGWRFNTETNPADVTFNSAKNGDTVLFSNYKETCVWLDSENAARLGGYGWVCKDGAIEPLKGTSRQRGRL
jgi:hypothetical protein